MEKTVEERLESIEKDINWIFNVLEEQGMLG